jgi:hypothetical protein
MRQLVSLFAVGAARRIYCCNGTKGEQGRLVVSEFEFPIATDRVEELDL